MLLEYYLIVITQHEMLYFHQKHPAFRKETDWNNYDGLRLKKMNWNNWMFTLKQLYKYDEEIHPLIQNIPELNSLLSKFSKSLNRPEIFKSKLESIFEKYKTFWHLYTESTNNKKGGCAAHSRFRHYEITLVTRARFQRDLEVRGVKVYSSMAARSVYIDNGYYCSDSVCI